ncbi:MAG: hypothetical protein HOQ05_06040 [Corynebacteriales bacterium]|nr:hypothetical protein [Mycobacteriales bacterium]
MRSFTRKLLATAVVGAAILSGSMAFAAPASADSVNVSNIRCSGKLKYSHPMSLRNIYWRTPTSSSLDYDDTVVAYLRYYYEPSRHTNCAELVKAKNPAGEDYDGTIYMRIDMSRSDGKDIGKDSGRFHIYAGSIRASADHDYSLFAEVGDNDTRDIRSGGQVVDTETEFKSKTIVTALA